MGSERLSRYIPGEPIRGIYAALITPVDGQGRPDVDRLAELVDFVVDAGVDGICLGGGTSEYPQFTVEERKAIISAAAVHLRGRVPFLTSIGASNYGHVLELGRFAIEQGSGSLLLPMPFFFRYEQQDLEVYARSLVRELDAPCLLYNLPVFTNPLHPDTARRLIETEPRIVGIKDSSGDRAALDAFAAGRTARDHALLCGSDGLFFDSLEAGWDGAISGIASCAPELLTALYRHHRAGEVGAARRCQTMLDELVALIGRLPFPWSIRIACEVRGIANGPLPWPLSEERREEVDRQRELYGKWFDEHVPDLREAVRLMSVATSDRQA